VTAIFIKAKPDANIEEVFRQLNEKFAGYALARASDANQLMADMRLPLFNEFRTIVVLVSMLISFMVILLAMYTTIFERTRKSVFSNLWGLPVVL